MNKTKSLLGPVILLATLTQSAHAQVLDGSFEAAAASTYTGDIGDGWSATSGTIDIINTFGGRTGNNAADLDYSYTQNSLSQTIATTAGQQYLVTFWLASDVPNNAVVTFGGQTLFNGQPATNGLYSRDYVEYQYDVAASSSASAITFSSNYTYGGGGYGIFVDDVSVTPVPEPAAFLPLGALGAFFLRRRR